MALRYLAAATAFWLAAGATGVVVGLTAGSWLLSRLPALAIDAPALGGAVTAIGTGLLLVGGAHVAGWAALRGGRPRATSGVVLLAVVMAVALAALAAAAVVSAIRIPDSAVLLVAAGSGLALPAAGYAWVAARLIGQIRTSDRQ